MRTTSFTLTAGALAAALLLAGCDSGGDEDGAGSAGKSGGSGGACALGTLRAEVGPVDAAPAAGDNGNVTVTLTNTGGSDCTLQGFPEVTLRAGDASAAVLPSEVTAHQLTVPAAGTASFTVGYTRGAAGEERSLAVKTVEFSLPGAAKTQDFPWSYGDVALRGEGVPEASVSPFQQAGD
ncbi:DUF4232 domain-containing protein [Streptomyces sp. NPDC001595]|uniref:DUF4232 domain-containing protein n=1 Tax=Streptomyces sp. NPDC001532 TaxID=3154520 RepID=UPI00331D1EB7